MFDNVIKDLYLNAWELSEDGQTLKYKPTEDLLAKYQNVFKTIFPNISVDSSTPQGQLITALTEQDTNDIALIADMANSFFFGGSGVWLDDWASMLFQLTRKNGIPSSVLINIEGKAGTQINGGFIVGDGSLEYIFDGNYIIPDTGKGQIVAVCTKITDQESVAGSVESILTPLEGIYRVTNPNNSTPALLEESDSEFLKRCIDFGSSFSNTSMKSIYQKVMSCQGVIKVNGFENAGGSPVTNNGINFPSHSFAVVVLGGDNEEIARAIQLSKPPCTGVVGDVEVSLPNQAKNYMDDPDYNETYSFLRPVAVPIQFSITCILGNNSPSNFQQVTKDAILEYINKIEIGGKITQADAICKIMQYAKGFTISSLKLSKKTESLDFNAIKLQFNEMAVVDVNDIVVVNG